MAKKIKGIEDLQHDIRNANKGTQRGRGMVEASLREVGAGRSIVTDKDGRVIAGNKTLEAAADIGLKIKVVETTGQELVVVQRNDLDLSDDTGPARKLAYYDNRAGETGLAWDAEVLLADLNNGVDLSGMFNADELDALLDGLIEKESMQPAEAQVDKAAELQKQWGTSLGQIWQLGKHRLACGDCTDKATVERLMQGERAELCFTSPPYADQRAYQGDSDLSPEHLSLFISSSVDAIDLYAINLGIKREGGAIVEYWDSYIQTAKGAGLLLLSWNVWSRHGFGGSIGNMTAMFPIEHEWILVFGQKATDINRTVKNKSAGKSFQGTTRDFDGDMGDPRFSAVNEFGKLGSVFVSDVERGEKDHPAMFPIELPSEYIKACTNTNHIVYEPFAGSGTTLIACEQLNRQCRAVEISPAYCAVILQRYKDSTGIEPKLIDSYTGTNRQNGK